MPDPSKAPQRGPAPRRAAVQIGLVLLGCLAVYLSAVSTYQILKSTLYPDPVATSFSCRQGAQALYGSLREARSKAVAFDRSERLALSEFRKSLGPVWAQESAIRALCRQDKDVQGLQALKLLERLRYAEERAVRYSSIDLSHLRNRAPALLQALASSKEKTEN